METPCEDWQSCRAGPTQAPMHPNNVDNKGVDANGHEMDETVVKANEPIEAHVEGIGAPIVQSPGTRLTPRVIPSRQIPNEHRGDEDDDLYDFSESAAHTFDIPSNTTPTQDLILYVCGAMAFVGLHGCRAVLPLLHFLGGEKGVEVCGHHDFYHVLERIHLEDKFPNKHCCQVEIFVDGDSLRCNTNFGGRCESWCGSLSVVRHVLVEIATPTNPTRSRSATLTPVMARV